MTEPVSLLSLWPTDSLSGIVPVMYQVHRVCKLWSCCPLVFCLVEESYKNELHVSVTTGSRWCGKSSFNTFESVSTSRTLGQVPGYKVEIWSQVLFWSYWLILIKKLGKETGHCNTTIPATGVINSVMFWCRIALEYFTRSAAELGAMLDGADNDVEKDFQWEGRGEARDGECHLWPITRMMRWGSLPSSPSTCYREASH